MRPPLRRLGRNPKERLLLMMNLATALIKHERIVTTVTRAKELKRIGDKLITYGKRGTDRSKQTLSRWMKEPDLVPKICGPLRERYADRYGGYTRVLRVPNRERDNAPMAVIELVDNPFPPLRPPRPPRKSVEEKTESSETTDK